MAATALRSVVVKPRFPATAYICPFFSSLRSFTRLPPAARCCRLPPFHHVRPFVALAPYQRESLSVADGPRAFSTSRTTSSLNDSSPNWSNRPPKETILLDGCDFEHWLCVVDPPDPNLTRDEIIKSYIQTLAKVVGSEEEARMKIYSVSTKHYFAFGALVSEELSYKIKELPGVRWVLPDSYIDVKNKDYGGEPFINGEAVPYDPKYHEEWVRNNARANERNRRNDRPRNFDRSRNFERRRENMQNFQSRGPSVPPPVHNEQVANQGGTTPPPPPSPMPNQQFAYQGRTNPVPPNMGGPPPSGGYQQQPGAQNPASSGGSNLNMGGFPNQGTNAGPPNPVPPNMGGPLPSGGYQQQPGAPNPAPGGGSNMNMGGFPNQGTNAGPPNPNFRGNQHQVPTGGGYGPNFGGYQTQVPSGAPNATYSGYQNQGPNAQNYGGGAYQGSHSGYQGYSSGNQGPNTGGFAGSHPNYQGNPGPYQGSPNAYQGRGTGYPTSNSYGGSEPDQFQPRDVPGRD